MTTINNRTVWLVDDDSSIRLVLSRTLSAEGYSVEEFEDAEAILEALKTSQPDVVITDIRMPGIDGLALVKKIGQEYPEIPCIIMTAHTDLDSALASYETGAFEYLPKPFDIDEAVQLVNRALRSKEEATPVCEESISRTEIIGEAPAMQEVFRIIGRLAKSNINVMICGQSGTGKELVANALHQHSPRSNRPFVAINIAAIPSELLESELFGHEKGAFTGATSLNRGRFEQANEGTLFLDEIGEMSAELQTRLLRVLSDRRFYRLGGKELIEADVRVLAATNQNLEEQVAKGEFREDLYHRLNVIRIDLPALTERKEDIPLLVDKFLQASSIEMGVEKKRLSENALHALQEYHWPGNVRQLENTCRWLTVMAAAQLVTVEDLPKEILQGRSKRVESVSNWEQALEQFAKHAIRSGQTNLLEGLSKRFERILLNEALQHTNGHRQQAAKILGWGRNTLARKLKEQEH